MKRRPFLGSILAAGALPSAGAAVARPRLFLDANRIAGLRASVRTTHSVLWNEIRANADLYAGMKPPAYPANPPVNDEQLWQREVGNKLPFLAMAYLITGEARYRDAAGQWALTACAYPTWGTGVRDGVDLAAGHLLFGISLVYDWLGEALPEEARARIRATLLQRGAGMYRAARETGAWKNSILQNHLWVNLAALTAAALALDEKDSAEWLQVAHEKFEQTEESLGPDGASHEGVPYWSYGVEYLLKYWDMVGRTSGARLHSPWWSKTAAYRLYLGLPRNSWAREFTVVDIADGPRGDYYGADYLMRRLAAINRDPYAQWLGAELDRAQVSVPAAQWLNLLWWDPSVEERSPEKLPGLRHFEDMGIVSARSSWRGDESLVVFKCGPPLGHEAAGFTRDMGSGHVHPDANHFVLFANGEWLLRDDGYAWKQTDQHNTLLVDGVGQMGEGSQWFRGSEPLKAKARPRVLKAAAGVEYDEIAGDAASIYPAAVGLKRYVRRLLFWKPDILIVVDDIETAAAKKLELRFHTEFPCEMENGALIARGRKAALRLNLLTPDAVVQNYGLSEGKARDGKPMQMFAVRMERTGAQWRNVVAISWCASGAVPPVVTMQKDGAAWVFRSGARTLRYSS